MQEAKLEFFVKQAAKSVCEKRDLFKGTGQIQSQSSIYLSCNKSDQQRLEKAQEEEIKDGSQDGQF